MKTYHVLKTYSGQSVAVAADDHWHALYRVIKDTIGVTYAIEQTPKEHQAGVSIGDFFVRFDGKPALEVEGE